MVLHVVVFLKPQYHNALTQTNFELLPPVGDDESENKRHRQEPVE